jgi:hypothetical protein
MNNFDDKLSKEYLKKNYPICPNCGSEELDSVDSGETDYNSHIYYQDIYCITCGATWMEVYKLMGIEQFTLGETDD